MSNTEVDSFLVGNSVPAAKFPAIGASVIGTVTDEPELVQQRDFATGEPLVWDDGNPRMQLVVTIQTNESDPEIEDDDGKRKLYVKGGLRAALRNAVKEAGASKLEVGGTVTVRYSGNGVNKKGGYPPKVYQATYTPPTTGDWGTADQPAEPHHHAKPAIDTANLPPEVAALLRANGLIQ